MSLPPSLQNAQLWPIKAKGKVDRWSQKHLPYGDPKIEKYYHAAMEQGRLLETSISDANFYLAFKKQDYIEKIQMYLDINKVASDAQFKHRHRIFALGLDIINLIQKVSTFQSGISSLAQSITGNIGLLQSMEQNVFQMVQSNLNAIANLLHEVCNWGLPDLPAIPNFFSDTLWHWNGFNFFPLAAFKPHVGFDFNFAFNQCVVHVPNINIFRNYPTTVQTYSDLSYGTPFFVPPLGGIIPNTGQNLNDPNFIAQMQATNTDPVYGPTFNANSSMWGSVPDPSTIISNYQMPAQIYHDNIVAIVPTLRDNVIEPADPDYLNPDFTTRGANLRKALVHFITLDQVVASDFDPYVTSAWLFYLDSARVGRGGDWLSNFEAAYNAYIQPSILSLADNAVPWNQVLPGNVLYGQPKDIPLVDLLSDPSGDLTKLNILWKLSYVEAAILGYTRSKTWDNWADANYISSYTATDLDFVATTLDFTKTNTETLGIGQATFPTPITFPTAMTAVLNAVIAQAKTDISNTPSYQSVRPQNRFVFDQFAQATLVDHYTQFWRDFATNLRSLLAQDPYLAAFTVNYFGSLNSAVNPLADPAVYEAVQADVASRNRSWTPGTPLLPIPKAPNIGFVSDSLPTDATNGWTGFDLDPVAFLSRPDIQAQPIPVQIAMLRTNLSFAALSKFSDALTSEIQTQIANAQATLTDLSQIGFKVTAVDSVTVIDPGSAGSDVIFDQSDPSDFDITGNVQNATQILGFGNNFGTNFGGYVYIIQAAGNYQIAGQLNWDTGADGERTVTVLQNGQPIYTASIDGTGPVTLPFATTAVANQGDVFEVRASHTLGVAQNIIAGSFFVMLQTSTDTTVAQPPSDALSGEKTFVAGAPLSSLTAVYVDSIGQVIPIDPTTIVTDIATTDVIAPIASGVTLEAAASGANISVGTGYGGLYQVAGTVFTVGSLIYVAYDGTLTQDYNDLVNATGPFAGHPIKWIICVGRAISVDTFLWEPHVPSRFRDQMP